MTYIIFGVKIPISGVLSSSQFYESDLWRVVASCETALAPAFEQFLVFSRVNSGSFVSTGSKGQERADKHKYKKTVEYMETTYKKTGFQKLEGQSLIISGLMFRCCQVLLCIIPYMLKCIIFCVHLRNMCPIIKWLDHNFSSAVHTRTLLQYMHTLHARLLLLPSGATSLSPWIAASIKLLCQSHCSAVLQSSSDEHFCVEPFENKQFASRQGTSQGRGPMSCLLWHNTPASAWCEGTTHHQSGVSKWHDLHFASHHVAPFGHTSILFVSTFVHTFWPNFVTALVPMSHIFGHGSLAAGGRGGGEERIEKEEEGEGKRKRRRWM